MIRTNASNVTKIVAPEPGNNPPEPPPKHINELLDEPEKLIALSDFELKALLAPYFPATRYALLPEAKPKKLGLDVRNVLAAIKNNAVEIAKLKALRSTK